MPWYCEVGGRIYYCLNLQYLFYLSDQKMLLCRHSMWTLNNVYEWQRISWPIDPVDSIGKSTKKNLLLTTFNPNHRMIEFLTSHPANDNSARTCTVYTSLKMYYELNTSKPKFNFRPYEITLWKFIAIRRAIHIESQARAQKSFNFNKSLLHANCEHSVSTPHINCWKNMSTAIGRSNENDILKFQFRMFRAFLMRHAVCAGCAKVNYVGCITFERVLLGPPHIATVAILPLFTHRSCILGDQTRARDTISLHCRRRSYSRFCASVQRRWTNCTVYSMRPPHVCLPVIIIGHCWCDNDCKVSRT